MQQRMKNELQINALLFAKTLYELWSARPRSSSGSPETISPAVNEVVSPGLKVGSHVVKLSSPKSLFAQIINYS